jgi:hypothetical protein
MHLLLLLLSAYISVVAPQIATDLACSLTGNGSLKEKIIRRASSCPRCNSAQINSTLCAVLYDETFCTAAKKQILPNTSGNLHGITASFRGELRAGDAESLIVRDGCKLEAWKVNNGFSATGNLPKLEIDKTGFFSIRNKYVDVLEAEEAYRPFNEAIKSYRCTC